MHNNLSHTDITELTDIFNKDDKDEKDLRKKPKILLSEKETLVRASTPSVLILLVCQHPDSLTTNAVIPYRDSFSSRQKQKKWKEEGLK